MNKKVANANESGSNKSAMPMFFTKPAALNFDRHGKAGLGALDNYSFASRTNAITLNTSEFVEAAKHYPIVFAAENATPIALVGLEDANYFVNKDGKWEAGTYIPAYVRKYPFIFSENKEEDQFVLCVDEGAKQYNANGGANTRPLYNANGEASEMTMSALEFLKLFQQHYQITQQFSKDLQEAGLLTPNASTLKIPNGRTISLGGFLMIDENKFNSLSDEQILSFRKKGWLPLIYFALMSVSNWKRVGDLAAKSEQSKK